MNYSVLGDVVEVDFQSQLRWTAAFFFLFLWFARRGRTEVMVGNVGSVYVFPHLIITFFEVVFSIQV